MGILDAYDATGQAELVRRGSVSPKELVDESIARIEEWDPRLNVLVSRFFEEARLAAASSRLGDGPYRGVPLLLKDAMIMQAGQPYYSGNRALRDAGYRCPGDTPLGARFRRAGFVTLGRTNLAEMGLQSTTQPLAFGPTRNPWALDRSPGGSSGGSAAATAAFLVPVAHAVDGGGSIRIPAAWCGLVGLKVSRGRISTGADEISPDPVEMVLSRTVRDTAGVLDAVHGSEPGDLYRAPPPQQPYASCLDTDVEPLRIGVTTDSPYGPVHPECVAAAEAAGRLLESLGHVVEPRWPETLFEQPPLEHLRVLALVGPRRSLRELADRLARPVVEGDVEPFTWALARHDKPPIEFQDYLAARRWEHGWVWRTLAWWESEADLLLTPTVCEPPPTLAELTPSHDRPWDLNKRVVAHSAFTRAFNVTGQPAISLPLHWTADGLPVGVQLVAAPGREDVLLRVASQLERACPWSERRAVPAG